MTDLVPAQEPTADLVRFAEEASQVHGIAKALASTSFVPKSMQGKPDEITGAILAGREMGLSPMTALASIDIIEGRASVRANTQRGLAQAAGVTFEVITANDSMVRMRAKPPNSSQWTEVAWPIERAQKMGLTGKSNWQKMPQAMLIARATSELCRLVAANVLLGMPYSTEELQDAPYEDARHANGAAGPAKPRKVQRATVPAADVAPDLEPEGRIIGGQEPAKEIESAPEPDFGPHPTEQPGWTEEAAVPGDTGNKISDNTRKAIMAGFNEVGVKDRTERLSNVSKVVGREINSVNQLTEAEGLLVVRKIQEVRAVSA